MKIVVEDGYTLNPEDLSWNMLSALGEFLVYRFIPEFKLFKGSCFPFEIIYPETCSIPIIYIPLTAEEIAHYDLPF